MEKLGPGDPQRIGGYRLLARLGSGGMGQVYLARSDRGRTVAVKLVRPELAAREEFRARFRQEVRSAQRVGGFWTAPVLDADTEAAVPWVATGYVAGPSLQQVVGHDHGPLPERSVRILAAGLAHALTNIHAAGIVHRDLKPSNVMVTIEGPRVIDFGVARALESVTGGTGGASGTDGAGGAGDGGLTQTGSVVGSPGFMAPEQVRGDRITPACDVFCLGSVLAYAATGALPFGAESSGVHALMFRIVEEEPELSGVPEGVADLVRACLRKEPAARPSLDEILRRTGASDTLLDGRSRDPWLPSALVAQLGQHAVRLLEVEDPEGADTATGGGGFFERPERPERPAHTPEAAPQHSGPRGHSPSPDSYPTLVAGHEGIPQQQQPAQGQGYGQGQSQGYGHAQQHPQSTGAAPQAYGYPHQHQQAPYPQPVPDNPYAQDPYAQDPHAHDPAAYGLGGPTHAPGAPGAPGGGPSYGPDAPEEPPRRSRRTTALLVAVALVVAVAAGGSLYALMNGGEDASAHSAPTTAAASATPGSTADGSDPSSKTSPSASGSPSPSPSDGAVPAAYLGAWKATIDNASSGGTDTRELTITQGKVGDPVLTLVADGAAYHCEFAAELSQKPGGDGPLKIGPSTVTTGKPLSSCTPGTASEVTLLSDGRLQRINSGTGEKLTYRRG
ncbi:protein kinase [Streptomyces sp. NBC_01275]|uniref:protein kinase domain-containing protein n=1 Tax=Streptomyces sp. NBC_01275 TaxID=2903807 RepID=UPI00225593E4|nr:protein kinase [Streptomyces sp. NBC_01275]MCX4763774.1 protein kinase [Streptomyces sp. NBC_01275]